MNKDITDKICSIDCRSVISRTEEFILERVRDSGASGVILGLSGGIDSAVLAYICKHIMPDRTLAMIMPDTDITPSTETDDAFKIISLTGISYKLLDIKPIVTEYTKYVEPHDKARGNLRARIRTDILYYYANAMNYLVLGSSDKSEYLLGYFTKFGDGASDTAPLASLYKLQIRKIAEFLGVPRNIISKKSSPHLWKNHTAEDEIGATYEDIDPILYCLFDKMLPVADAAKEAHADTALVQKIYQSFQKSMHKRELPRMQEYSQ